MSKVIDSLVNISQSAFIKGRCILDNIATAEELIFSLHKRRLSGHIIKVDFAKAFDMVNWDFLLELLGAFVFGSRWISWVKLILISSKANFFINGSPKGYVRYLRGLRQGDPLSPLLFALVSEVLNLMFNHALESRVLVGVPLGNLGKMCHLQFANDLLILMAEGIEDLQIIKLILYLFEGMSGLAINFHKTCIFSTSMGQPLEN